MMKWAAGPLALEVDAAGNACLWVAGSGMKEEFAPFAHITVGGRLLAPVSAGLWQGRLRLQFDGAEAEIEIAAKDEYLRLAVTFISGQTDDFIWGPFPVGLCEGYGEIIGAAWAGGYAVCMQALNPKTVGGIPKELEAAHPLGERVLDRAGQRERVSTCAALPLSNGTALQAFSRNRTRAARRDFYYAKNAWVEPIGGEDAVIEGSAIALFACRTPDLLSAIGRLEIAEGLPHPMIGGEWGKTAARANESFLITNYYEDSFDEALEYARAAGLTCVYHSDPFENWGHFELSKKRFPSGEAGMRACAQKAAPLGIHLGTHTLSNFTTTNDPYVTPAPHPKLLKMGGTQLLSDIGTDDRTLLIRDDTYFKRLSLVNAARLGDELVHYEAVEARPEGIALTGCERGAWGTGAAAHAAGCDVFRLWDYDYRTLFPDAELQREYSRRLGELFVNTGLERMSFDGLEGCAYTGHDEYANARFVQDCYDVWGPNVRSDASGLSHYRWHMHTYMNWGEPWYADMRNSMYGYRVANQAYFKRNLLPPMVGWYALRLATRKYESTTPDDMEWMLSKAAGFGAGFAFCAGMDILSGHALTMRFMGLIRMWEAMRFSFNIPEDIRLQMQDQKSEWHLEEAPGGWLLHRAAIMLFECSPEGAQPGMPSGGDWMTFNPYGRQPARFRLRAGDERDRGAVVNPSFTAGEEMISFELRLESGQYLIYDGGMEAQVCDGNFFVLSTVKRRGLPLTLGEGVGMILFRCLFEGEEPPYPQMKVFSYDEGTFVPQRIS